jgi:hypothetical protein
MRGSIAGGSDGGESGRKLVEAAMRIRGRRSIR